MGQLDQFSLVFDLCFAPDFLSDFVNCLCISIATTLRKAEYLREAQYKTLVRPIGFPRRSDRSIRQRSKRGFVPIHTMCRIWLNMNDTFSYIAFG